MKNNYYTILFFLLFLAGIVACEDTGTGPNPGDLTGESVSYDITAVGDESPSGTVTFAERVDGFTRVTVELSEVPEEEEYPVRIYSNSVLEGGELLIELTAVDDSEESITIVSENTDGEEITYEDLISLNGHLAVHPSEDDLETVLARADIGGNALTGESVEFDLEEQNDSGISGTVEFFERNSGHILAVIELTGTDPSHTYPAHLYSTEEDETGERVFVFNKIDGETGLSQTNISELEDESSFEFDDLDEFQGYVRVYDNEDDMTILSTAEIDNNSE